MAGLETTGSTAISVPAEQPTPPTPAADPIAPATAGPGEERRRRRRWFLLFLLGGLLLLVIGIAIWYFLFRQPIPLPSITTAQMPGYTTSIYGSSNPVGVAVSPDGDRIYVAETEGERVVRIFDAAGNLIGTAAPAASTGAEHVPVWLAIDPITSSLYVSDRPTGSIYVYDRDGGFQRTLELASPIPGWQPMGIAFDRAGNLYVADAGDQVVQKLDQAGNLVATFGADDGLWFPNGVAVDGAGNVIVADSNNGRLMAYRPDGTLLTPIGRGTGEGELGLPRGVAVDGKGWIYVGDATAQGVSVFKVGDGPDAVIEFLGFIGGPGSDDGQFAFPNGVAADGRGRIYISDTANDRIQVWSY
jgi:DNA-binding beta-propeller fold protein YncE